MLWDNTKCGLELTPVRGCHPGTIWLEQPQIQLWLSQGFDGLILQILTEACHLKPKIIHMFLANLPTNGQRGSLWWTWTYVYNKRIGKSATALTTWAFGFESAKYFIHLGSSNPVKMLILLPFFFYKMIELVTCCNYITLEKKKAPLTW